MICGVGVFTLCFTYAAGWCALFFVLVTGRREGLWVFCALGMALYAVNRVAVRNLTDG